MAEPTKTKAPGFPYPAEVLLNEGRDFRSGAVEKGGISAAKQRRGKRVGRPRILTPERLDMAHRLLAEGKGRAVTARMIGVDPATLNGP